MGIKDHALVVGINRYPDLSNLQGAEADATEFAEWLETDPRVAVPADHIKLLLSSSYAAPAAARDARPMAAEVNAALEAHIDRADAEGGSAGDRLYLYFSGHGIAPDADEVALLMANAGLRKTGHYIPGRSYTRWFREALIFKEIVLFMDCCRQPALHVPPSGPPWGERAGVGQTNYLLGFATSRPNAARESAAQPGAPVRGVFSRILLEGLKGAAPTNNTGELTASILEGFILSRFRELFARPEEAAYERQEPKIESDPKDTFVLVSGRPATAKVAVRVRRNDGGSGSDIQVFDHDGQAQTGTVQNGVLALDLAPGWYKATAPGPRKELFEIGSEGGPIDVVV